MKNGRLILKDGFEVSGISFGSETPFAGEVVFSTGMMGYPESLTDPSYKGQILVLTYPLVGNYGIPDKKLWESEHIQVSGLIVSNYIDTPSHFQSKKTLAEWFKEEHVPLLEMKDTRLLTQHIRKKGSLLGKIIFEKDIPFYDPDKENLVEKVSTKQVRISESAEKSTPRIILIDCGAKRNIQRALSQRGVTVITVPWDFDPFSEKNKNVILNSFQDLNLNKKMPKLDPGQARTSIGNANLAFDGIIISNGPGNPKFADKTIMTIQKALKKKIPVLGICLGHQLLTLAAGGDTKKLKYGHRSQNQPCRMEGTPRCYITTQNHGFAVSEIPAGFEPWFTNANDQTNEGIIHKKLPCMSVQFHPEATPGPMDAEWIFDFFLKKIKVKS